MSKNAIKWAAELRIPKQRGRSVASMKAVLLCLCWHADDVGQSSYPSLTTIQAWSGLNRQAVSDALRRLEELEIIEVKKSRGRHNVYSVAVGYWSPSQTSSHESEKELVALDDNTSRPPVPNWSPSPTRIESNKSSKELPIEGSSIGAQRLEVDEWLDEYAVSESAAEKPRSRTSVAAKESA